MNGWRRGRSSSPAAPRPFRYLGLDGEEKLVGHGLTSCATCDGAFYKNVPVCVVGGGDSASEESTFLTRFASKVYLIHRRDKMRASMIMQDRVFANKKIEPIWDTVVTQYIVDEKGEMRAVRLRNVKTNDERELEVACVFVAIGHDPNTKAYRGKLDMDAEGYLLPKNGVESKLPGVFIAGDVADRVYKQAATPLREWAVPPHCGRKNILAIYSSEFLLTLQKRPSCCHPDRSRRIPRGTYLLGCFAGYLDSAALARNDDSMKVCDLTQFYSPASGGVKRYSTRRSPISTGTRRATNTF